MRKTDEVIKDNFWITKINCFQAWYFIGMCGSHYWYPAISEDLYKMGSFYAYCDRNKSFRSWNFPAIFITLWEWKRGISSQHSDGWQNMKSTLRPRNESSVHEILSRSFTCRKIMKNPGFVRKTHNYSCSETQITLFLEPNTNMKSEHYIATFKCWNND